MAVIILLGVIVMGATLGIAMQRDMRDADVALAEYDFKLLARDAAASGLELTAYKLANSYTMGSWVGVGGFSKTAYRSGFFKTTITAADPISGGTSGDTVNVVSRGMFGPGRHVIFARYARDKDDKGIPPAFKHALVSDNYMQIDGNMLIAAINNSFNASIHTNGDLTVRGNSFLVEGYGTYTGTVSMPNAAQDNFVPNIDYNGPDPNYHPDDSVRIVPIDEAHLRTTAQSTSGVYINTPLLADNVTIDFTDPSSSFWVDNGLAYTCPGGGCGTEDKPFVLFIENAAQFRNTVEIIGNGIIFTTLDATVSPIGIGGGIYGLLNQNQETTVMLATSANINVDGNACFGLGPSTYQPNAGNSRSNTACTSPDNSFSHGITLYAEQSVNFSGTPFIVGGVVARDSNFTGGGNPWITYASVNEGTFDAGFEWIVPIGPILIAYSEF